MSENDMKIIGLVDDDRVVIDANGYSIALLALLRPGQAVGTVSVAVGYGRTSGGAVIESGIGKNAFPFYSLRNGTFQTTTVAALSKTGDNIQLAQTQTHHSYEGRNIVRETSLAEFVK